MPLDHGPTMDPARSETSPASLVSESDPADPTLSIVAHTVQELSVARRRLRVWLVAVGVDAEIADAIMLAGYEAIANAVEHAYPDQPGPVTLTAAVGDRTATGSAEIILEIRDRGRWRPPLADPGSRGRGLEVIRGLGGQLDIDPTGRGTTVVIRWPDISGGG